METFARTYHLTRLWKFRDIGDCFEISLTVLRDDTHRENNKTVAKQSTIVTINNAMRRGGVVISNNYRLSTPSPNRLIRR